MKNMEKKKNNENWDFIANTPGELANGIGSALLKGKGARRVVIEKRMMTHLLEALACTSIPQYPVRVRHTTDNVPDFQLVFCERRIAVELMRIGFQDIAHGGAIHEQCKKGTFVPSQLYPSHDGPRKREEVIQEALENPPMLFSPSACEEDRIFLEQAKNSLDAKSLVIARNDFAHGDEDWLVLVDPLGMIPLETQSRQDDFSELLTRFWKPGWFSRVFLQDNYFRWQMMFRSHESSMLHMNGD